MTYLFNDGGRVAAGFPAEGGDCVARAVAVASGRAYREVHKALSDTVANKGDADKGVPTSDDWQRWMAENGFSECGVYEGFSYVGFSYDDPRFQKGRYVLVAQLNLGGQVTGHAVAMVDGVVHDAQDHTK